MKATAIDSLSDMIATTVVLIGTIVSAASGIIIDGYCGVLVGMFILYSGFVPVVSQGFSSARVSNTSDCGVIG